MEGSGQTRRASWTGEGLAGAWRRPAPGGSEERSLLGDWLEAEEEAGGGWSRREVRGVEEHPVSVERLGADGFVTLSVFIL